MQVETTNACNADCIFCPHNQFDKIGIMGDVLYEKIVQDASQYHLNIFIPMLTGEPFCDRRIIERIRLARELMPRTQIMIYSNGSLIMDGDIENLANMGNIKFNISLNGASVKTRQKLMGLNDWEIVKSKVIRMDGLGLLDAVSMVWYPTLSIEELKDFSELPRSIGIRFQSFAGENYRYKRTVPTSCRRVTESLTVMWHGQVNLCCFDPFGRVNFGNLNSQTIEEIWNSPLHLEYLAAHKENRGQEMRLCESCTEGA